MSQDFGSYIKEFQFYFESSDESLKCFNWENDLVRFLFQKDYLVVRKEWMEMGKVVGWGINEEVVIIQRRLTSV